MNTLRHFPQAQPKLVAPELGDVSLGTQGDPWDAQQDMALATLGAIVGAIVTVLMQLVQNPSKPSGAL